MYSSCGYFVIIIMSLIRIGIIGAIIFFIANHFSKSNVNRNAPVYSILTVVTGKKSVDKNNNYNNYGQNQFCNHHRHNFSICTISFCDEYNNHIELPVNQNEFDMIVEGDHGILTFQGNKFLSFKRT